MESDRVICKAYDIDKYDSYMAATLPRNVLNAFSISDNDVYLKNGDLTFTLHAKPGSESQAFSKYEPEEIEQEKDFY